MRAMQTACVRNIPAHFAPRLTTLSRFNCASVLMDTCAQRVLPVVRQRNGLLTFPEVHTRPCNGPALLQFYPA
jgi:hypothetical protein